jgi:hypothetical protein
VLVPNVSERPFALRLAASARLRIRAQLQSLLVLLLVLLFVPGHAQTNHTLSSEEDLRLLQVRLEPYVLSDAVPAFEKGQDILLPLGELARLLTIAVTTDPEDGSASGYILEDARSFHLDAVNGTATLAGNTTHIDTTEVEVHQDDIYVASSLVSQWFPVDFDIDLAHLRLRANARKPLPLQQRLERERRNVRLAAGTTSADLDYPRKDVPYKLLTAPSIDQAVGIEAHRGRGVAATDAYFSSFMTGDLLGMQSRAFLSGRQHGDLQKRITLGRDDPDAGLLGALQASSFAFGSVPTPTVRNIVRTARVGNGFTLSNHPLTRPQQLDRQSFQGDLLPGWDVELYQNGALIGYQQSEADGSYRFDDVPLGAGANEFRLVFRGPQGQTREERRTFLVEDSLVPVGELQYRLAGLELERGGATAAAQFDWGLSPHLTASTGMFMVPVGDTERRYADFGLHANWAAMTLVGEYARSDEGGDLTELALKTRVGSTTIGLSHAWLRNFSSEVFLPSRDPVSARTELRMDGSLPLWGVRRLPFSFDLMQQRTESGRDHIELSARASALLERTWITHQVRALSTGGAESFDGVLQLSRGFQSFGLRGQVNYGIAPTSELTAIALTAERRLGFGYVMNAGMTQTFVTPDVRYHMGLSKQLGQYGLGINSAYSRTGELTLGAQLFASLGRDPRTDGWVSDSLPMADSGFASVRVFLDSNLNGVMDAGEQALEGVGFTINGARRELRTNADGVAYLHRLPTRQPVNLAVDPTTLEDPQWSLAVDGARFVPRAGATAELDFPVIMTGEVDGMIYIITRDKRRPVAGMTLELLTMDPAFNVIREVKTASDGFFLIEAVPPGKYLLRVAPADLKRSKLSDTGARLITVSAEGDIISGVDLFLTHMSRT